MVLVKNLFAHAPYWALSEDLGSVSFSNLTYQCNHNLACKLLGEIKLEVTENLFFFFYSMGIVIDTKLE